jgi:hypothetical protein
MRVLTRPQAGQDGSEVDEFAMEFRIIAGPDGLHRQNFLAHYPVAQFWADAVVLHGVLVPDTYSEQEPSRRQLIKRGHLHGQDDRIVQQGDTDTGSQLDASSNRSGGTQSHERIEKMMVPRMIFILEERGTAHGNMGVLNEEQRLKASSLDLPGQVANPEAAISNKSGNA